MRIMRGFIFLMTFGVIGMLPVAIAAQGQNGGGTKLVEVKVGSTTMEHPVWITKVTIGNQFLLPNASPFIAPLPGQVMPNQDFTVGNDWLKEMTIEVINRTDRPLANLSIALRFPQTGSGHSEMDPTWVYRIQLGRIPDVAAFFGNGEPIPESNRGAAPLNLQPGGRITIHVADYINKIEAYLKTAMPLAAISQAQIFVDYSILNDGLRWSAGAYSQPDSDHRGQWKYYPVHYFPGNSHQYLPGIERRIGERPEE